MFRFTGQDLDRLLVRILGHRGGSGFNVELVVDRVRGSFLPLLGKKITEKKYREIYRKALEVAFAEMEDY